MSLNLRFGFLQASTLKFWVQFPVIKNGLLYFLILKKSFCSHENWTQNHLPKMHLQALVQLKHKITVAATFGTKAHYERYLPRKVPKRQGNLWSCSLSSDSVFPEGRGSRNLCRKIEWTRSDVLLWRPRQPSGCGCSRQGRKKRPTRIPRRWPSQRTGGSSSGTARWPKIDRLSRRARIGRLKEHRPVATWRHLQ